MRISHPMNTLEASWPLSESSSTQSDSPFRVRLGTRAALFVTGLSTFLNLYVTQPLLPQFRQIFQASELLVSLTVTGPVLAVAVMAPLIGLWADHLDRKRVIVTAILGLAVPTALAATASDLESLLVWRFLQGFSVPGVIAVVIAYISEESPRQSVGSTMATYVTGTVVGGFFGRFLMGWGAPIWGWRVMFALLGAATLIGGLVTWRFLPPSTHQVRPLQFPPFRQTLSRHLHNPQLLAIYLVGFNVLFCLTGTFTYVNFHLADRPFNLGPTALASIFAVYLVGVGVTPLAGRLLDRFGPRRTLIGAVGMGVLGILLTLIPHVPFVIAGLALGSSGTFVCQSAASSYVGKAAGEARSSAAGLYVSLYYLGGCAGSILPGVFWRETGWLGCVGLIVCIQGITALVALKLWKD